MNVITFIKNLKDSFRGSIIFAEDPYKSANISILKSNVKNKFSI